MSKLSIREKKQTSHLQGVIVITHDQTMPIIPDRVCTQLRTKREKNASAKTSRCQNKLHSHMAPSLPSSWTQVYSFFSLGRHPAPFFHTRDGETSLKRGKKFPMPRPRAPSAGTVPTIVQFSFACLSRHRHSLWKSSTMTRPQQRRPSSWLNSSTSSSSSARLGRLATAARSRRSRLGLGGAALLGLWNHGTGCVIPWLIGQGEREGHGCDGGEDLFGGLR